LLVHGRMLVYILIFGLAVIFSVLLLWYFDPLELEGFQTKTYTITSPAVYSGIGGTTQLSGTVSQAQAACDSAPGCVGFLYYAGMAYLNTGEAIKMTEEGPRYDTATNDLTFTLPNDNIVQTVVVNALRRYVRVGVSRNSPDGYVGLDQVVVLDDKGNNAALGKRSAATGSYPGTSPHLNIIDGTTTGRGYPNVWNNNSPSDYWELDLGTPTKITSITIYSPNGGNFNRISGVPITVSVNPSGVSYSDWAALETDPSRGMFTLSGSGIDQTITPNYLGRYVRIRPILYSAWGDGNVSLSSVIVRDRAGNNISIGKPTYTTSIWPGTPPVTQLVDGKTTPNRGTAFASGNRETEFIEIDLGSEVYVATIRILGGSDCCFPGQGGYVSDRQKGLRVIVSSNTSNEAAAAYATAVLYKAVVPVEIPVPIAPVQPIIEVRPVAPRPQVAEIAEPIPIQPLRPIVEIGPGGGRREVAEIAGPAVIPLKKVETEPKATSFWDLVYKVDKEQDPVAIGKVSQVSDPDPNDTNDLMPLKFSKYISIYALSQYGDLSGARQALFNNYNSMQSGLSKNVYSPPPEGTDLKARSCANLDAARNSYTIKYNQVVTATQDLSGMAIKAGAMREENLAYQNANIEACKGGNRSPACISLASQEGPLFSLLAKYDTVNNTLATSGAIDISNNLNVINTAYKFLGCAGAPLAFSQNLAVTIDTQTLISQLNQMSPYYLSPDTLQYITTSIISGPETDKSLMTDAEMLINISRVISNIKTMTGAS